MYINDNFRGNHLATKLKTGADSYVIDFTNPDFNKDLFLEPMRPGVNTDTGINQVLWRGDRRVKPGKPIEVMYLTKQTPKPVHYRILHGWD